MINKTQGSHWPGDAGKSRIPTSEVINQVLRISENIATFQLTFPSAQGTLHQLLPQYFVSPLCRHILRKKGLRFQVTRQLVPKVQKTLA